MSCLLCRINAARALAQHYKEQPEVKQALARAWKQEKSRTARTEMIQRIEGADATTAALVSGRMTLREAASRLIVLYENLPKYWEDLRAHYPRGTDLELAARDAVERARSDLVDPAERERVAGRLAAEFRILFPEAEPPRLDPAPAPPVVAPPGLPPVPTHEH